MPAFRDYTRLSFFLLAGLVVAGCSAPRHVLPPEPVNSPTGQLPEIGNEVAIDLQGMPAVPSELAAGAEGAILTRLTVASQSWDGTPYLFGGTTRDGADCSGFVQQVFGEFFGMRLTRATATQVREGREIEPRDLQPGDLVFFRTGPSTRHVGIYLYDGHFLHSSSRRGVTIDQLRSGFYERTFWTARRVIPSHVRYQLAASVQPEDVVQPAPIQFTGGSAVGDEVAAISGPASDNGNGRVGW